MSKVATVADAKTEPAGDAVTYPYSQGDLLDAKPVYNFSAFKGAPFLHAYAASRRAWLAGLPAEDTASGGFAAAAGGGGTVAPRPSPSVRLADLLEDLCLELGSDGERTASGWAGFLRLVQRFEVTKRLWTEVDDRFRAVPGAAPADVRVYALFGLAALLLNRRKPHLSLLNAALKAHDIVTSQDAVRIDPSTASVARIGVGLEMEAVAAQAARAGVAI